MLFHFNGRTGKFPLNISVLISNIHPNTPELFRLKKFSYQERYSGVHVEVFQVEADHADSLSKRPAVCEVIIEPEGQREDVNQVCQSQIYHERYCLGLLPVKKYPEVSAKTCSIFDL